MPDSLIEVNLDVGGLTEPATVLIERVSDAIGGIAKPWQIERVAKAEAKANLIVAQSEIEITDLQRRAAYRWMEEETRNQLNIENATYRAIPHLNEDAKPDEVDDDFIVNWSENCRTVSDEQMQEMWARILAGEANNPGTFSRKAVNVLADMDKSNVELFATLCRFVWIIDGDEVALISDDWSIFPDHGITIQSLANLESLGLISRTSLSFRMDAMPAQFRASYFGRTVELTLSDSAGSKHKTGSVVMTSAGLQLGRLCDRRPLYGLFDFMCERWKNDSNVENVELVSDEQLHTGAGHRLLGLEPKHELREAVGLSIV